VQASQPSATLKVLMTATHRGKSPFLSVIVAVRDVEDSIGRDVRALAKHLRQRGLSFEILASSDGSHDTSLTLLRFLHAEIPELSILGGARPGRAFKRAVVHACGETVLLWESDRGAPVPHAVLGWALSRLARRAAVVVRGRFLLAHRLRALPVLLGVAGRGDDYEIRFEREASGLGLDLEVVGQRPRRRGLLSPVLRILSV
jgi:glycosyltransferase involved in cell wall biosynthesis